MPALSRQEILFAVFLIGQFAVVFFVVVKYVIDKLVERRFEELHQKAYPDAQIVSSGAKIPFFKVSELVFLIVGPAIMAASMVFSLRAVLSPVPQDIRSKAAESEMEAARTVKITENFKVRPEVAVKWQKQLDNIPVNPTQVIATTSAKGKIVILTSEKSYSYPEVTFTWSGDKAVEQDTKTIGYYVYFGTYNTEIAFPNEGFDKSVNPLSMGVFVTGNSYTAKNLEKGKTYYLYIQTKSNSKNQFYDLGLDQVGYLQTIPARKLFIYKYE